MTIEEKQARAKTRKMEVLLGLKAEDGRIDIDLVYTELKRRTLAMAEVMNNPYAFDDEPLDMGLSCSVLAMLFQLYADMLDMRGND